MALQKKTGQAGLQGFYWILGIVAVVGIGALLYTVFGARTGGAATEPVELEGLDDPRALVATAKGVELGVPTAPVKVLEFGDYMCPGCGTFALRIKPLLVQNYVDTGKIQFVFYDFPLPGHRHSFVAARAARCAGEQQKFWEYHDVLFARQGEWSFEDSPVDEFVEYAGTVGLDGGAFEQCLKSDRFADVVTANALLGEQLGVRATPTIIVNGRRLQDFQYESIRQIIDQELGGSAAVAEPAAE